MARRHSVKSALQLEAVFLFRKNDMAGSTASIITADIAILLLVFMSFYYWNYFIGRYAK